MIPHEQLSEPTKHIIDGASAVTAIASFMQWLPAIASVLSIAWTVIRLYEWIKNKTVTKD